MSSQSGYNTVTHNGFAPNEVDAEGAALLRKPSRQQDEKAPLTARLHEHFTANISKSWADIALLGCYIITGLLDSSSVFIWGSFVSMQTGKKPRESAAPHPQRTTPTKRLQQATPSTSASASSPPPTTTAGSAPASPSSPSASEASSSAPTTAPSPPASAGY
jgi:hypothetical protein